jgi:F-type H+-transporting ATPase subunit c
MIEGADYVKAVAFFSAALAMGLGSIGPALGQGLIGAKACENVGKYPKSFGNIRTFMFISMALVETAALYCLLIALLLIYAV